jgi:ATP-binding cassette subfamily B protein
MGIKMGNTSVIWSKGLQMAALSILSLACALLSAYQFSDIACSIGEKLNDELTELKIEARPAFRASQSTHDITQVQSLISGIVLKLLITAPLLIIGAIALTAQLSQAVALIFLYVSLFMLIPYFAIYYILKPLYQNFQKFTNDISQHYEWLMRTRLIQTIIRKREDFEQFKADNFLSKKNPFTPSAILSIVTTSVTMFVSLTTIVIGGIFSKGISNASMDFGVLMGIISYLIQIIMGFGMLLYVVFRINPGLSSMKRLNEVLDMPKGL